MRIGRRGFLAVTMGAIAGVVASVFVPGRPWLLGEPAVDLAGPAPMTSPVADMADAWVAYKDDLFAELVRDQERRHG